jgi:ribosomal protein L40E
MPEDPEINSPASEEAGEQQLCISCAAPNDPWAHFCRKCGAPLTSNSATGPLERILAEGYIYRQAAERPRKFIVVLGVWFIFGPMLMTGGMMIWMGRQDAFRSGMMLGLFVAGASVVMIVRTTRNYLARGSAADPPESGDP